MVCNLEVIFRLIMNVIVNGKACATRSETVAALIQELRVEPARVAVLINEEVVPKDRRGAARLREGDRIELVAFTGGG